MRISDWSSDVCSSDLIPVEPVTEQWRKPAIALRRFECVEAPVGQARNARLEIEPEEMHRCEHDVGNAASIDVQRGQIGVAVMAEEPIERMDGFSCRAGDHRLVQRRVAVRSEEHTSELQSLMRISYAVFCLKKKNTQRK